MPGTAPVRAAPGCAPRNGHTKWIVAPRLARAEESGGVVLADRAAALRARHGLLAGGQFQAAVVHRHVLRGLALQNEWIAVAVCIVIDLPAPCIDRSAVEFLCVVQAPTRGRRIGHGGFNARIEGGIAADPGRLQGELLVQLHGQHVLSGAQLADRQHHTLPARAVEVVQQRRRVVGHRAGGHVEAGQALAVEIGNRTVIHAQAHRARQYRGGVADRKRTAEVGRACGFADVGGHRFGMPQRQGAGCPASGLMARRSPTGGSRRSAVEITAMVAGIQHGLHCIGCVCGCSGADQADQADQAQDAARTGKWHGYFLGGNEHHVGARCD